MQLSLLDIYNQMGNFAKGIVFVLAAMSIWSLSVAIKKWWDLRAAQKETRKFAPEFSQFLEEDNLAEAVTLADKYKNHTSPAFLVEHSPRFARSFRTDR
jgi:biopolymer transport protein ExbB